jgi:hypothetical protein
VEPGTVQGSHCVCSATDRTIIVINLCIKLNRVTVTITVGPGGKAIYMDSTDLESLYDRFDTLHWNS